MSLPPYVTSRAGPALLAGMALAAALAACAKQGQEPADHLFVNGMVWTGDPRHPAAEAVAVRGDTIVFVGERLAADAFTGPGTVVHDLDGKMLLPGFIDGHAHVLAGGATLGSCDLQDVRDVLKIRALLEACARERAYGPDEWVLGNRWPMAPFENGSPPKAWLDEIFAGRPAYFVDSFGHNAWVSSRALEIAGIDASTPDPPQGKIERGPDGAPNGTLREDAMELVGRHIPAATRDQVRASLSRGLAEAARFGITAFIEPGLDAGEAAVYRDMDRDGLLTARVLGSLSPLSEAAARFGENVWPLLEQRAALESGRFKAHSVKVYIDGVIESQTSHMLEPYNDGSNFRPFYEPGELAALYTRLDAMGLQIHTHAIGDGAIRLALDAYQAMRAANGPNDNRHQVVHLQLIDRADVARFGQLGVAANFQGLWAYPDDYIDMAIPLVGEGRVKQFYPLASVQRAGGLLVGGSDWDVSSLNPLDAIETMVRRQDPWAGEGAELGGHERIDLDTALAMYTRNAAWIMRLEDEAGTLEAGKKADLVVLDRNLFDAPPVAINEALVELTMLDGKIVYASPGAR